MKTGYVVIWDPNGPITDYNSCWIDEKCPECGSQMVHFDGGDQGGVPFDHCSKCNHEVR